MRKKKEIENAITGKYKSFHPGKVWLDTNGNPIQAHGFSVFYNAEDKTYSSDPRIYLHLITTSSAVASGHLLDISRQEVPMISEAVWDCRKIWCMPRKRL